MPFVLRKTKDESNPTLPDAWGVQQTAGRLVYWVFQGGRTYFLILFGRGGKYGWDGLNFFRYKGVPVPEFQTGHDGDEDYRNWRFHRGTVTKQIAVRNFTANHSTNTLTSAGHTYANDDKVRARSLGGVMPADFPADSIVYIINSNTGAGTFQVSETSGGSAIDFTTNGTGTLKIWKADAGFDDPEQGRPQFFPELNLTFSNICYIEGMIPAVLSADEEPKEFQFGVRCRRVADYDVNGDYVTNNFSANNARVVADILFNELKRPLTRNHWDSWVALKESCETLIWQRTTANGSEAGTGLTGRYYNHPNLGSSGTPPVEFEAATLVATRTDATINFNWVNAAPTSGVNTDWFLIRWEGKLKPQYSEIYTFKTIADNGVRVWVNNQLIIDRWLHTVATDTGQIELTAGVLVNIKVEYFESYGNQSIQLFWSSASRSQEIIPATAFYPSDAQVKRAEANVVCSGATQAAALIESVMKRAPGWHIQDVNGTLKYLPPDRPVVHHFVYDPNEADTRFNIAAKTYEVKPRLSDERTNFRYHYYNDLDAPLLEEKWVEADRPELREDQGGLPSDVAPERWGVMSRSLTTRCAEMEMKIFSDPDRDFTFRGMADSYPVSKGDRVLLSHISTGETLAEPVECMVSSEQFGAGAADEKSYSLLPVAFPLSSDEEVVE